MSFDSESGNRIFMPLEKIRQTTFSLPLFYLIQLFLSPLYLNVIKMSSIGVDPHIVDL